MSDFFRDLNKSINTDGNIFLADDANSSAEFAGSIDTGKRVGETIDLVESFGRMYLYVA